MAGSMKWVVYESDDGNAYAVKLDESNSIAGGFVDIQANAITTINELPRGRTMRYVNCKHSASGAQRRLYLGQAANPLARGGTVNLVLYQGTTAQAVPFVVTSYRGEQRRTFFGQDTGLDDGTAE